MALERNDAVAWCVRNDTTYRYVAGVVRGSLSPEALREVQSRSLKLAYPDLGFRPVTVPPDLCVLPDGSPAFMLTGLVPALLPTPGDGVDWQRGAHLLQ